jgi:hypothetical protein
MAKKAAAKGRAGNPLPAASSQTDDGAHGVTRPTKLKPSSLLDTRAYIDYMRPRCLQLARVLKQTFDYTSDAMTEIGQFFKRTGKIIRAFTVRDILDKEFGRKLA